MIQSERAILGSAEAPVTGRFVRRGMLAGFGILSVWAGASGAARAAEEPVDGETEDAADMARKIDIPSIGAPITVNGRLVNYMFLTVSIEVGDGVDAWAIRDRAHFMRDAMLRAAHRTSLGFEDQPSRIDGPRAARVLMDAAMSAVPPRSLARLDIVTAESLRR
jgi:hypothetical protein